MHTIGVGSNSILGWGKSGPWPPLPRPSPVPMPMVHTISDNSCNGGLETAANILTTGSGEGKAERGQRINLLAGNFTFSFPL